jgi:hypothetical protein
LTRRASALNRLAAGRSGDISLFFQEDVAMMEKAQSTFDLDQLLHPSRAFGHPSQVVADPDLTLNEKRAILAAWASDACALEACPEMRELPGGRRVRFDDIMDALRDLDREAGRDLPSYRRAVRKKRLRQIMGRGEPDQGNPLQ